MTGKPWSAEDERALIALYPATRTEKLAQLFGRTRSAVASRAKMLKVQKNPNVIGVGAKRKWGQKEDAQLRALYPNTPTKEIGEEMGRPFWCIYGRAAKLGLRKTQEYLNSPAACRLRRGDNVGAAFRFKKGMIPQNKGLRRPGWAPGRMAETQFKKGERRGVAAKNWCPIGTIRPDSEGFLRIKVREGVKGEAYGFGNVKIWPLLNRHVWESHRGPIPSGHIVVFKDGNRANCAFENLELISFADNMRRNTVHNLPKPLSQVIQLRGALTRKLRRLTNAEEHAAGSAGPSV